MGIKREGKKKTAFQRCRSMFLLEKIIIANKYKKETNKLMKLTAKEDFE